MIKSRDNSGLALLCDREGRVQKVLYDELNVGKRLLPGQSFLKLIDVESVKEARKFVDSLRLDKPTFDCALMFHMDGKRSMMQFVAYAYDDAYIVIGAKSNMDVVRISHRLLQSHFQQVEARRHALGTNERMAADREAALLTEIVQLKRERELLHGEPHENAEALPPERNLQFSATSPQLEELRAAVAQLKSELGEQLLLASRVQCAQDDWQAAFYQAPVALCIAALPDGAIVTVNDRFQELTGYSRETIRGLLLTNLLMMESLEPASDDLTESPAPADRVLHVQLRTQDDHIRSVRARVQNLSFDGRPCLLVSIEEPSALAWSLPIAASLAAAAPAPERHAGGDWQADVNVPQTPPAAMDEFLQHIAAQFEKQHALMLAHAAALRERALLLESHIT